MTTIKRRLNSPISRFAYLLITCLLATLLPATLFAQEQPWMQNPNVREVLQLRQQETDALLSGTPGAGVDNLSSTFVANTPDRGVVTGEDMKEFFKSGTVKYDDIKLNIEYAGAHGNDVVVIMGVEIVVPGAGLRDAGKHVYRRFTDLYRRENGIWRHDMRHANVIKVE